jgi:hypothetical protein
MARQAASGADEFLDELERGIVAGVAHERLAFDRRREHALVRKASERGALAAVARNDSQWSGSYRDSQNGTPRNYRRSVTVRSRSQVISVRPPAVCTENLNTGVAVMKSAQDGA